MTDWTFDNVTADGLVLIGRSLDWASGFLDPGSTTTIEITIPNDLATFSSDSYFRIREQ